MGGATAARAADRRLLHLTGRSDERPCGGSSAIGRFRGVCPRRWPHCLARALPRGAGGDRRLIRASSAASRHGSPPALKSSLVPAAPASRSHCILCILRTHPERRNSGSGSGMLRLRAKGAPPARTICTPSRALQPRRFAARTCVPCRCARSARLWLGERRGVSEAKSEKHEARRESPWSIPQNY